MHKTIALAALVAAAFCATDAYAASEKQKKPEATQQKSSPPPSNNVYGPGCKNQGASIMSGGCVN